jgi:hypothetical protein
MIFYSQKKWRNGMSSTIENITCHDCGGNAQRETDHKTGGIYEHCNQCDYEEIIAKGEERKKYKLVNISDGNNEIELESDTEEDAIAEALEVLGWSFVAYKDE